MDERIFDIRTEDGRCDAFACRPDGAGPFPTVLFFMDGLGVRPVLHDMARRLAAAGYFVLLPNLYYREGRAEQIKLDGDMQRIMKFVSGLSHEMVSRDASSFLGVLGREPAARADRIGCTGYCMGGGLALSAAGRFPDRIAAAASIHGARLATDAPDSPHRLARAMKARIYVGVAEVDPFLVAGETDRLRGALEGAGVDHEIELYPGVQHGFAVAGNAIYDRAASERHWERILALFGARL